MSPSAEILVGDSLELLKTLPNKHCQMCVTSPPYFGLRDYGMEKQMGLESTPEEYVERMAALFDEVRRVLKDDGTLWLNLGDSYAVSGKGGNPEGSRHQKEKSNRGSEVFVKLKRMPRGAGRWGGGNVTAPNCKSKDLIGIPWMLAFALRSRGWYLRCDIIWAKANCMPESVTDRPTRSHEFIFLLSKARNYFYDHEAIKEPCIYDVDGTGTAARKARAVEGQKSFPTFQRNGIRNGGFKDAEKFSGKHEKQRGHSRRHNGFNDGWDKLVREEQCVGMRNKRDVWTVAPANFPEAHFATFPPDLIRPCILAGSRPCDTVLDPFAGSGTTGAVALEYGRNALLLELNPKYAQMAKRRCDITPGLAL